MSPATAAEKLVDWFRENARELPWRSAVRDPYHVLVSELMLQQTQVERVVPRFEAFIDHFPTVAALAAASEEEVLGAWSGLGYYRRARLLHKAAQAVVDEGGAEAMLPDDVAGLRQLPGVGPYTAAAVASLAFGRAEPVLDGNVARVVSRVLAASADPKSAAGARKLRDWVSKLMTAHPGAPGEINEALMELGATVCSPRSPDCAACPFEADCRAHGTDRIGQFPMVRAARPAEKQTWVVACCVDDRERWLLRKVDTGPVLRRLWLPPFDSSGSAAKALAQARRLLPGLPKAAAGAVLPALRHSITYRRISVFPVLFFVDDRFPLPPGDWTWASPDTPGRPTSSLLGKLARAAARDR